MADGLNVMEMWNGRGLSLPALGGPAESFGGLLLGLRSDSVTSTVMPDGGSVKAVFNAGNFGGHWPSKTEITTTLLLSSRAFDMRIVARNAGGEPEPVGIGWMPKFAVLGGDRNSIMLRMPQSERIERGTDGVPTGRLLPVAGTPYDFTARNGTQLGTVSLNDTFVHMKPELLDNGPEVDLRDPGNNFELRLTALTPVIKAMRVYAPADKPFVTIDPMSNYDDALGREWPKGEDTGTVVLQPGQSMQWNIRLEIFPLTNHQSVLP
jgi:galactose mutarotase-like enzyme